MDERGNAHVGCFDVTHDFGIDPEATAWNLVDPAIAQLVDRLYRLSDGNYRLSIGVTKVVGKRTPYEPSDQTFAERRGVRKDDEAGLADSRDAGMAGGGVRESSSDRGSFSGAPSLIGVWRDNGRGSGYWEQVGEVNLSFAELKLLLEMHK